MVFKQIISYRQVVKGQEPKVQTIIYKIPVCSRKSTQIHFNVNFNSRVKSKSK